MIMSNTPTKISAGKFVDLSLKTFGDVSKKVKISKNYVLDLSAKNQSKLKFLKKSFNQSSHRLIIQILNNKYFMFINIYKC